MMTFLNKIEWAYSLNPNQFEKPPQIYNFKMNKILQLEQTYVEKPHHSKVTKDVSQDFAKL